jgi:hypothetical protein
VEQFLYVLAFIFIYGLGPLFVATVIAAVWRGLDEIRCRIGWGQRENLRFFGLYIFRGLLVTLMGIAVLTVYSRVQRGDGPDPMAQDSWNTYQQSLKQDTEEKETTNDSGQPDGTSTPPTTP